MQKISLLKFTSLLLIVFFLVFPILTKTCFAVNVYNFIDISSIAQRSITGEVYRSFPFGEVTIGDIDFYIPESPPNFLTTQHKDFTGPTFPNIATFSANIDSPNEVYLLINGGNTYKVFLGKIIGKIILSFTDNSSLTEDLTVGYNFRDWNLGVSFAVNTLDSQSNATEVTPSGSNIGLHGEYPVAVDMLKITIPSEHKNKTLRNITLKDISSETVGSLNPAINLLGITVVSPSPSISKPPIILLPGMMASWNTGAILEGTDPPRSDWQIAPFVTDYNGLIQTIKNAGYTEDKDFFIFPYDWRDRVEETINELNNFIENTVKPQNPGQKINLIGHSLGGLIARIYTQNHQENIDQVISVGSPHQGVVQIYKPWAGGELDQNNTWTWLAQKLLLEINREAELTTREVIQRVIPGLSDLLPVFNFLKSNDSEIDWQTMNVKNNWLLGQNNNFSQIFNLFTSVFGNTGSTTPEWFKVANPGFIDNLLGNYPDGKPTETENGSGDGTILQKSAKNENDPAEILSLNHRDLIKNSSGVQKIIDLLNLSPTEIVEAPEKSISPALILALFSPAKLKVSAEGEDITLIDDRFAIIFNPQNNSYPIEVEAEGEGGEYELLIGKIGGDSDYWTFHQEEVGSGETDNFTVSFDSQDPSAPPFLDPNGLFYLSSAKKKVKALKNNYSSSYLNSTLTEIERAESDINKNKKAEAGRRIEKTIKLLPYFRKKFSQSQAWAKSVSASEDLVNAYQSLMENSGQTMSQRKVKGELRIAQRLIDLAKRKLKRTGTKIKALSFEEGEKRKADADAAFSSGKYFKAHILAILSPSLLLEALR